MLLSVEIDAKKAEDDFVGDRFKADAGEVFFAVERDAADGGVIVIVPVNALAFRLEGGGSASRRY